MNPVLALIITNVIWGAAPPIFKFALTDIPPFTLAFIRFFFASLIFFPLILHYDFKKMSGTDWKDIVIASFVGITLGISFFFMGLEKAPSINLSILGSSTPIFLFLFSVFVLREKPKRKVFLGMLLSFLGVLAIIFMPFLNRQQFAPSKNTIEGNLLFIAAVICITAHPVLLRNVVRRVNVYVITFLGFLISGVSFFPLMLWELRTWQFSNLNYMGWIGIVFGTLFSSGLAYFLFNYGIARIKIQEVGLFAYMDPVVSIVIAAPLLGEHPDIYFFIGAVLVFGGIFLAEGRLHWHPLHKLKKKEPSDTINV